MDRTRKALLRTLRYGVVLLGLLTIGYLVAAVTVAPILKAGSSHALVLRNAYPVGQVPADTHVYASTRPVDYSLTGKAWQVFHGVEAGSVVQIVTGPNSVVRTDAKGWIIADGKRTAYRGKVARQNLTRQYIAICVAGACDTGAAVRVDQDAVVGEVRKRVTWGGLTEFPDQRETS